MASVQMPRLSDSMETGKILRWLKKEGEDVKKGEPLVEIESDKANIEVEAYASGKLSKIVVAEGESAPIGAVIAEIGGAAGGSAEKPAAPQGQAPAAEPEQKGKAPAPSRPKRRRTSPRPTSNRPRRRWRRPPRSLPTLAASSIHTAVRTTG